MQGPEDATEPRQTRAPTKTRRVVNGAASARLVETTAFGPNPGALRMLSHAPAGLRAKSPLVVVLHGCTQDAAGNAVGAGWLRLADRLGFAVLAPEQTAANNLNRCFNWFLAGDTQRERGECASIAQMIGALTRSHDLDPARVYITGLSAGGAMTAAMLATYPELFAGGAIIAGLPYGAAHNLQGAMAAMRGAAGQDGATLAAAVVDAAAAPSKTPFRLSIWQGDNDRVVDPSNAQALIQQWTLAKAALQVTGKTQVSARLTRTTWSDTSRDGARIELNMIAGLGHGTPLSTTAEGDVGSPAPFLLECGVSSTLEIARFWGLDTVAHGWLAAEAATSFHAPPVSRDVEPAAGPAVRSAPPTGVAAQVLGSIERHVPKEIQDIIAQSLRAAGLLK